jgi:hypothetical protein
MSLLDNILRYRSLSIVGMAKNTGKTVCLNYILEHLQGTGKSVAVTSIGLDGEKTDQVTQTEKPEVTLHAGTYFVTSEFHYRQRELLSEIYNVSDETTSLGRLVTARAIQDGKVIISGPSYSEQIRRTIKQLQDIGVDLTIVDGALSRKSSAAPAITESLILTTGAAVAPDLNSIVSKTRFVFRLTQLPQYETPLQEQLMEAETGIYALENDKAVRLPIASPLLFSKNKDILFSHGNTLFISGIIVDNMVDYLRMQPQIKEIHLVAKDFTRLFVSPYILQGFLQKGGKLSVLKSPNLIAVCANPTSPTGYKIDSGLLCRSLQDVIDVPVYDIKKSGGDC